MSNSLLETIYLLKSPANAAHLERSITQFKQGKVVERELLDDRENREEKTMTTAIAPPANITILH
jgi:hypothetical protein